MKVTISILLVVVGLIHLLPVVGVFGRERLAALYGVPLEEPNVVILLRHRAALFGVLGALLVSAAFLPALQPAALVAGGVSVASFLWVARAVGSYNAAVGRVVWVDVVALGCLLVAGALYIAVG